MRFLVEFHVMINGKKITAIKDVRSATGMGLAEAKNFCETFIPHSMDSHGGTLICSADQVARLTELDVNSRGINCFGHDAQPTYAIVKINRISPDNAIDISGNILH